MTNKVIFTICAKNYLAQALALKESLLTYNPQIPFVIFISDTSTGIEDLDVIFPDESWIPSWNNMAFKYNVIEYSTSIKPFCINLLFEKYDKVIYVDPDTYATNSFESIFSLLDLKDIVITPHYNEIQNNYNGAVPEEELLFVGIYNLGFLGIKKSDVGIKVVDWWMNRLENKCYADKYDALHVDQKWFDFIPAFFPNNICICHHLGINVAIWNLHERSLSLRDGNYYVESKSSNESFELIFFHFSGFNPKRPDVINRRHPSYNVDSFPTFRRLFKEYTELVLAMNYERFSHLPYGYNIYSNSEKITPLQRRLYRQLESKIACQNPFDVDNPFYKIMKENGLLTGVIIKDDNYSNPNIIKSRSSEIKMGVKFLKILKFMVGVKYYNFILSFFAEYHRLESQEFLISETSIRKYLNK
ncbi:hypothetical protein [Pedobacter sp. MR2016-24]|uniref:hypothetical protein n=1 Tax=Pedobacter sp. MR2016-24 TaxID=2994466 RepID=UPI002247B594|nr:hypothetical protein [Pedobacter sp. MR2016-24]MCX2485258.1 hypothetical protein [Pedobacter sp. MR2016-24]